MLVGVTYSTDQMCRSQFHSSVNIPSPAYKLECMKGSPDLINNFIHALSTWRLSHFRYNDVATITSFGNMVLVPDAAITLCKDRRRKEWEPNDLVQRMTHDT